MKRLSWPCSPVFDALFVKEVKRGIFPAGTSGRKGSDKPFLSGGEADRRGRFGGIKGANANSLRGQGSRGKACPAQVVDSAGYGEALPQIHCSSGGMR